LAAVTSRRRFLATAVGAVFALGAVPQVLAEEDIPDLAQVLVPVPRPNTAPVVVPAVDGRSVLQRAESALDAGRYQEALSILDAGPLPAEAGDLVTVRRAELAVNLGDFERARAELARPELVNTANRILMNRSAAVADKVESFGLAGELWAKAAQQPAWTAERATAMRNGALAFSKAGLPDRAADMLAMLADAGIRVPRLGQELASLSELGHHHAGLVALARGDSRAAAASFRAYLTGSPGGQYAAAAQRRLAALERPVGPGDGWSATRDLDTAAGYAAWVRANPNSPRVPDARFFQGLAHYRAGALHDAFEVWLPWTGPEVGSEVRARGLYWTAKVYEALGEPGNAAQQLQAAAGLKPTNYYTVRSADRLAGVTGWPEGGMAVPPAPTSAEEAEVDRWLANWAGAARESSAGDAAALRRAGLFASVGLEQTAGSELDRLIANTDNPRVVYEAGKLAFANRLWPSSARAGVRLGGMSPAKSSVDAPLGVRRLSYPGAYPEQVAQETARANVGPLLLLSLMRQESFFDRFALSVADARGLTQVIPSTGAELAKALGVPNFVPEQLHDPNLAVLFGVRYLSGQLKYFDGDVFRAVAAYNAGGGAAGRWARGTADPDIFVEAIEYGETREYVKSIYQYHSVYRGLVR
jgi:soluble lytic murein transglycosylase-like protein/TolA-binding protein